MYFNTYTVYMSNNSPVTYHRIAQAYARRREKSSIRLYAFLVPSLSCDVRYSIMRTVLCMNQWRRFSLDSLIS